MKRFFFFFSMAILVLCVSSASFAINVDVYAGHSQVGGGAPYSDLVGSFTALDIMFATNTGYAWHPFGLAHFGADITGCISVAADGVYTFTLDSDDGSLLFIDGILVVDNGGPHPPQVASASTALTAGLHPFEVQFFEDFGGPSGVDLHLPDGVEYAPCLVDVDIKPGSCPNPLNVKSKGVVPVAIAGPLGPMVDPATVKLEGISALESPEPLIMDVTKPVIPGEDPCYSCFDEEVDEPDGIEDLVVYFDTQELTGVPAIADAGDGNCVTLTLEGWIGPVAFEGMDAVIVKKKGNLAPSANKLTTTWAEIKNR